MSTCTACLRRAFYNLYGHRFPNDFNDLNFLNTSRRRLYSPPFLRTTTRGTRPSRTYTTIVATSTQHTDAANDVVISNPPGYSGQGQKGQKERAPGVGRTPEWAARKELEYLSDPFHIAARVKAALGQDNYELAAQITRESSKDRNVTVSWNHLIDYQLQRGSIQGALKLYNEMKKRGSQPNAQTFTIIFRGCAKSDHPKLAVSEAVRLYQNMLSVGRIKPNTIHLNAVLQVCAKVGDLDSMFNILSSSNDPIRSPNNLTYTTILNALRMKAEEEYAGHIVHGYVVDREVEKQKQIVIKRAKAIWEEVISRWNAGSLIIDEELVCAMGRILLMGGYADADAVESLIEQTMKLSRASNKGLSGREGTEGAALAINRPAIKAPGAPAIAWALPGNNSLSMILEAVEKTRRTTKAIKYWNVFTHHYHVVPDANNWSRALRVYHRGKNSGRAATSLKGMPSELVTEKHVRLAMKTCLRDNLNRTALDNATAILKVMGQTPSTPDVQSLRAYLQVAHASKRSFEKNAKHNSAAAMDAWAKSLAEALENVFGPYQAAAKKYHTDLPDTSDSVALERARSAKAEVMALARKMCAAYSILTDQHSASLTPTQLAKIRSRHAGLTRVITNYFETEGQGLSEQSRQEKVAGNLPKHRRGGETGGSRPPRDTEDIGSGAWF
ncbi:hypothetical protein F5Y14DRAFT_448351 [Nemania sp. NC0429]|nr:hypothetical protein F5Y14DRAFT_448351 [Nemania sp. NC0429]